MLAEGRTALDAVTACFPAGTLSGAPKVRAMEIIDEVEPVRRGMYAGCAGYFAANGSMDTCILLRTALVKDDVMYVQAGVGVVADSDLEAEFHTMVERAKEYILAGDIFQVVLSQRFELPFTLPPFSLYRSLRRINPSPFLIFFDYGDFSIVGSSPEILVRLRDNTVTIRPIAGTRRRGATPPEDRELAAELLADPKERAEHLMLLDLGRNDVGRVAKIGSVRVVEQFTIEKYSHLQHISSHVEGTLDDGLEAIDALKAGFPAGTLSGAPKVRAMEIIDEVEPVRRGIYAGCAGYFAANGSMDTCIMLRTGLVKDNTMYVQAGVGVVADSDLEAEFQESVLKARALVRAAEEAVRFANDSNWTAGNTRR